MRTKFFYLCFGILILGIIFFVTGCGNPRVSGSVKFSDGTPLKGGIVVLQNEQSQGIGELNANGMFNIYQLKPGDGLARGKYRGYIMNAVVENEKGQVSSAIPEKYTHPEKSGIEYDTESGHGKLEIVIERLSH
jgi:hypothetical protein